MTAEAPDEDIPPEVLEKAHRLPAFAFRGTGAGGMLATIKALRAELDACRKENATLRAALARSESGARTGST